MCPDRQILSALVDGEVPSPWDEKLLRHVETCPECARVVQGYRAVSKGLCSDPGPDPETLRTAVWSRLTESERRRRAEPLWKARFAIPLPLAAAALLAVAVLSTLVFTARRENNALRMAIFAASELTPSANQTATMESVLQFLGTQDPRVMVTIQLPPGAGLQSYGNPVFLKAPDLAPFVVEGGK